MTSIVDTLRSRESKSYVGGRDLESRHALYDAEYAVRRLQLSHQLRAHDGCVNTIQWDASGRWLVSGSGMR